MGSSSDRKKVELTRKQKTVLEDVFRYTVNERADIVDSQTLEWVREQQELLEQEDCLLVGDGDQNDVRRLSREFANEVENEVSSTTTAQRIGDFYEAELKQVLGKIKNVT